MRARTHPRSRTGFTSPEMAAVAAVSILLCALLAALGGESRRQARLGEDLGKLRQIGTWTGHYASDSADKYWTLSWTKGAALSAYPDLNAQAQASDTEAASAQAVDILRRVAGRTDIAPITSWIAPILYSHLALEDYLKSAMPDLTFVSAGDRNRLQWARDPFGFDQGLYQPNPCGATGPNACKRNPYASSFQLPTSFYDQSPVGSRVAISTTHNIYLTFGTSVYSGRLTANVAFPSQKVHVYDAASWHFGRASHSAFPEMRTPLLFADGAVQVRAAADSNQGWQPNTPTSPIALQYTYQPAAWEPPTLNGSPSQFVSAARFRFSRGFLDARDFGGPEACTGQTAPPGCP